MATVMKCDRCGCYYDPYGDRKTANALYLQNPDIGGRCECDEKYDLCPNCMDIVKYWLGEDEIKAKPCSGERDA
jgi:hypothetical protein